MQITDAGLAHLRAFSELGTLVLASTKVTDAGLVQIAGLKSVRWLQISDTPITDKGIREFQRKKPNLYIVR